MASEGDNDLASLLRAAGVRVQGREQISPEVRAAVEAEWQATRAARARRRKRIAITSAVVVLVVGLVAWFARPLYMRSDEPLATASGFLGPVEYRRAGDAGWTPLTKDITLRSGHSVRTGQGGRVRLALVNGLTVVLDSETRVGVEDLRRWELRRGAVYVDSGPVSASDPRKFRLKTPDGNVKQLGAQFEARIVGDELHVSVRSGHVVVTLPDGDVSGTAGELLTIEDDKVSHRPIRAGDHTFDWVQR
jgi:ferric-dicitrate binding protein FerR (iron transport regulator)